MIIKRKSKSTNSPSNHITKRIKEISSKKVLNDSQRLYNLKKKLKQLSLKKRKIEKEEEEESLPPIVSQFLQIISDLCKNKQNELIDGANAVQIGEILVKSIKDLITESEEVTKIRVHTNMTTYIHQIQLIKQTLVQLSNPIFFSQIIAAIQFGQTSIMELEKYGSWILSSRNHNVSFVIDVYSKNQLLHAGSNRVLTKFVRPILETIGFEEIKIINFFDMSEWY